MCGIAGWIDYNKNLRSKENIIDKMSKTLINRGPDAHGVYLKEKICLIHRRLIVVDPEHGTQPMTLEKGNNKYTMVYNGELYNTEDLRKELLNYGYDFRGHSDTEVLLTAFIHWKESCLEKLNGIYAFAIWDEKEEKLFMARDRMGVKPLFFYINNGSMIFGSQIKTLLANPLVKPVIDEQGLSEIFLLGPGRTSGQGIIKGIKELKPGEYAIFDENGLKIKTYWKLKAKEHLDDINTTVEKMRFLIKDAVKRQLVSDVSLCCFLSGGLDSSIISNLAAKEYKANNKGKLHTYSVDYVDNQQYFKASLFQPNSDKTYINMMVNQIDSIHHEVIIDNSLLADALEDAVIARDLPGMADIDSSLLLFCKEVKKDFTVAISGECADEIFGGYPWYHNKDILFQETFPWSPSLELRKSILKKEFIKNGEEYVKEQYENTIRNTDTLPNDSKLDIRMKQMFMLNINWFMQTLLDRKDRMSMYNGLEVRVPFCDHRIVEYAYNMPWEIKALDGREKGIVRKAMEGILPEEIVWRKKSPYPKTHNPKYFKKVSEEVKALYNKKNSLIHELINWDIVKDIIVNPNKYTHPWYGQLMTAPQMLAYILQVHIWLENFNIEVEGI
ncbi:asparagine synthase (glutamine-hydrolyzing) [Defluviitalea phaphyphila]|uniref:asparagine synthase (glutamine-hydrolyzing) n=1 Tax=Defluviitalea phaphyphila TaxID=1473580 RepID=UPI0007305765|nr:asparagine synthase (glutamine-hydrolyzing) [Defluviitalea phaphyphila]